MVPDPGKVQNQFKIEAWEIISDGKEDVLVSPSAQMAMICDWSRLSNHKSVSGDLRQSKTQLLTVSFNDLYDGKRF